MVGGRSVSGLTRERIVTGILQPYADRPAAALDTLKKLRILIRHAMEIGWLNSDPSAGIKRPKTKEIRACTEFGKPFTVNGFSGFMRDAIRAAGLPLDCKPHGLRKTMGRLMADADVSSHDIMAALGHTTLKQAENYTREADRRRGGRRAVAKLNDQKANRIAQTASESLGKNEKAKGKSK